MPMYMYSPKWDVIAAWHKKFKPLLKDYTGIIGIRLHRTGNPLTLELMGKKLPERELYPLATYEVRGGEPTQTWAWLETEFDIPWVKESDYHAHRQNVMGFYHAEDLLEPRAEEILTTDAPEETLRKAMVDHSAVLV